MEISADICRYSAVELQLRNKILLEGKLYCIIIVEVRLKVIIIKVDHGHCSGALKTCVTHLSCIMCTYV